MLHHTFFCASVSLFCTAAITFTKSCQWELYTCTHMCLCVLRLGNHPVSQNVHSFPLFGKEMEGQVMWQSAQVGCPRDSWQPQQGTLKPGRADRVWVRLTVLAWVSQCSPVISNTWSVSHQTKFPYSAISNNINHVLNKGEHYISSKRESPYWAPETKQ